MKKSNKILGGHGHGTFLRNLSYVMGGTAFVNMFGMLCAPVLTRLFTPENFGTIALMTVLANIGCKAVTLSYENAIIISPNHKKAFQTFYACLLISGVILSFISIVLIPFNAQMMGYFNAPDIINWSLLLPIIIFLKIFITAAANLSIKLKLFNIIAKQAALESIVSNTIKILLGIIIGAWTGSLIAGILFGLLVSGFYLNNALAKQQKQYLCRLDLKPRNLIAVLCEYKKFPLFNHWAVIMNTISENMLPLFFSILFSPVVLGYYSLSNRIIKLPMRYFTTSFQKVYIQKAAQEFNKGINLKKNFIKSTTGLVIMLLPFFIILSLFGEQIFTAVFGKTWSESGVYAQILAPGFFLAGINKPANVVFTVLQMFESKLIYTILFTFARAGAIAIGYFIYDSIITSLVFYSFTLCAFNIFYIGFAYFKIKSMFNSHPKESSHEKNDVHCKSWP